MTSKISKIVLSAVLVITAVYFYKDKVATNDAKSSAINFANTEESKISPKSNLIIREKPAAVNKDKYEEAPGVAADDSPLLSQMHHDLEMDLQKIDREQYVKIINDPTASEGSKTEALQFMGEYLKKLNLYLKERNKQLKAMMEKQV